jgi:hypothetical protein
MNTKIILLQLMRVGGTMAAMDPIAAINVTTLTRRASLGARATDPTTPAAPRPARRLRFVRDLRLGRPRPAGMGSPQRPSSRPATNR